MKILLAGYNVDYNLIRELKEKSALRQDITPETISAAYARISRSPKSVNELRADALTEVDKARKSNRNIVFEMGHSSVAEHAVFNIDVIGVSRLLTEEIEKFRLCSYTEKSQRYVLFDGDFVVPAHTHFWGRLTVSGTLELGPRSSVALDISCWNAIIGSQSRIKGPIVAHGDVTILDHASVHSVRAGGKVILRTGIIVGDVTSADTIIVHGKIKSGNLIGKSMKVLGN